MAGQSEPNADLQAHERSYNAFSRLIKWGTILSFIVAMIVVIIIA